jgi:CRP/FNR family transcriptional regulator
MEVTYTTEKIAYLKQSGLCHSLSDRELKKLAEHMSVSRFRKGETIIKQGTLFSNAVLVLDGSVKKYMELPTGKKRIIEIFRPVYFASLLFVMDAPFPCIYSMSALEESLIGFIDISTLKQVISNNGKFGLDIILYNASIFKNLALGIFNLNAKQMNARVADVIISFAGDRDTFELPVTQVDMSQIIGVTPENLSNILKSFKDDKIISIEGKKIIIHQKDMLKKISLAG